NGPAQINDINLTVSPIQPTSSPKTVLKQKPELPAPQQAQSCEKSPPKVANKSPIGKIDIPSLLNPTTPEIVSPTDKHHADNQEEAISRNPEIRIIDQYNMFSSLSPEELSELAFKLHELEVQQTQGSTTPAKPVKPLQQNSYFHKRTT